MSETGYPAAMTWNRGARRWWRKRLIALGFTLDHDSTESLSVPFILDCSQNVGCRPDILFRDVEDAMEKRRQEIAARHFDQAFKVRQRRKER